MSSTPFVSTGAGPASVVGPARSASSRQDRRADPISRSSSSQSSHASLSGEANNVANIHQQKNDYCPADATCVRTDCLRPMRPVRPDRPPDVLSHPMRLVPPNALIPPPMHPARLLRPPSIPTPP